MDHDGAGFGIAVLGIEPKEATGTAMFALIDILGEICSLRGRCRAGLIREFFYPTAVIRIRTTAMRNKQSTSAAAGKVEDMEARQTGSYGKIGYADVIVRCEPVFMALIGLDCRTQKRGFDRA